MIVEPKIRGFVCVTSHPKGCEKNVQKQIEFAKNHSIDGKKPKNVLVIGSSTGYGLSSRIVSAFGCHANTLGIEFERLPQEDKPASAGWYNSQAVEKYAHKEGIYAKTINGDAFSNEIKQQAIDCIKKDMKQIDLVVYSLASPKRIDPFTNQTYKSVLKPIGSQFTGKTLDPNKKLIQDVTIESASQEEISETVKVMGGEDWSLWIKILDENNLIAKDFQTVAYSYIGPEVTWSIYKDGTIGRAKEDLEFTANALNDFLKKKYNGTALISVNKAVVTQASSAIPVVPLYISLLFKIMKEKNIHEGTIEQAQRLFSDFLCSNKMNLDEKRRIRLDDWEMREDVQNEIKRIWPKLTTENMSEYLDCDGYQNDFVNLFGFGLKEIDYSQNVDHMKID